MARLQIKSIFILFILFYLSMNPNNTAHAFDLTELAGPTLTAPNIQRNSDSSLGCIPGFSWAAGLSFGFQISSQIDFAPEVIFSNQNFALTSDQAAIVHYIYSSVQVPLLIRYWIHPYFSAAGGLFISRTLSKISAFTADQSDPTVFNFTDLNWSQIDAGLMTSARYRLPLNEVVSFIIDTRLLYGLKNLDTSGAGQFKSLQVQVFAGLHYTL